MKNCVHYLKNDVCKYTKLGTFFEKFCTLNVQNCCVHFLKKKHVCWMYKIAYFLWKIVCWMYWIVCIFWKIVYVKYTKLCTLFEKLCSLNTQNWVHYLKNYVHWMYRTVTFFENLCTLNIQNCVHFLYYKIVSLNI